MKKKLSTILLILFLLSLSTVNVFAEKQLHCTASDELFLSVCDGKTTRVSALSRLFVNSSHEVLRIPVEQTTNEDSLCTKFDLTNVDVLNKADELALSDYLLEYVGFTPDEIKRLPVDERVDNLSGTELGIMRVSPAATGTDKNSYGNWSSTLMYVRESVNKYMFKLWTINIQQPFSWGPSICVQGFAMDTTSFTMDVTCSCYDSAGKFVKYGTEHIYGTDSRLKSINEGNSAGSGVGLLYSFPHSYTVADGQILMKCRGYNSNVNVPGAAAGSTGGAFEIYGNSSLVNGNSPKVSFSFPWGVSITSGDKTIIPCHTRLTAILYQ